MTDTKAGDDGRTKKLSRELLEKMRTNEKGRTERPELALVVYYRDGARVAPLAEGQTVVVGRTHPADVAIRDVGLSRQHAAFEVENGRVWVEDLGSTNGTWVDGLITPKSEVRRFEAELVRKALRHTARQRKEAAKLLGIPRRTLADKIAAYDLGPE